MITARNVATWALVDERWGTGLMQDGISLKKRAPAPPPDQTWRLRHLLLAPHRLGFALAMAVLASASLWWALVQVDRFLWPLGLHWAASPTVLHAAVMTFGFMPLFFTGFLFTAGPRWLGVQPMEAVQLRTPLLLQAIGWFFWLAGGYLAAGVSAAGLLMALAGLGWLVTLFWQLVRASQAEDRLHARIIGAAGVVGCLSLAGTLVSVLLDATDLARTFVRTGLWGFVVVTFITVAHRMIPFFTSSAVPMVSVWRPFWVLWVLLAATVLQVLAAWVDLTGLRGNAAWLLVLGLLELAAGGVVVWLAVAWGLVQSLKIRLLAMLHIGFVWLGIAYLLSGVSHLSALPSGQPLLGLAPLHALSMGCLGSLMVAMVTRVSCGHSGRALVADNWVWALLWTLQLTTGLRIAGAVDGMSGWLILLAALLWAAVMTAWALRYGAWFGRLRVDGKPG